MRIKELTIEEFKNYCKTSPLHNYMQSCVYARLMGENHYIYDYIGFIDDNGNIKAASLILIKKIGINMRYGYAPKGFLINYYDTSLIKQFLKALKEFYAKKKVVFIKINPEIVVAQIDSNTFQKLETANINLKKDLEKLGIIKLKDNLYFESMVPRFNAYIDLKNINNVKYSKANRNKINSSKRKGLKLIEADENDLNDFLKIVDKNRVMYYRKLYDIFAKENKVDLMLIKVDFQELIKQTEKRYQEEENRNNLLNEILHRSNKKNVLNKKMASDILLVILKNQIIKATDYLKSSNNQIVAGAFVVKYENRAHIVMSTYIKEYSFLNANYFLYDSLINHYKENFDYLDLGGISGDFKDSSPYLGLNRFKIGFGADIYEYIGEFDIVFNKLNYEYLLSSGKLAQEFNKDENL